MRLLFEVAPPILAGRVAALSVSSDCRVAAAHHDVGADAARALLGILDHAVAQTHQAEDQRHRHADEQDAQQAAHRPVLEIFENELAGHFFLPLPLAAAAGGVAGQWRLPDDLQYRPSGCVEHKFIIR